MDNSQADNPQGYNNLQPSNNAIDSQLSMQPNNEQTTLPLTPEEQEKMHRYKTEIDITDTNKIIQYGASSQYNLNTFSKSVLEQIRTKDLGDIGDLLAELSSDLNAFDGQIDQKSFLDRFRSVKKKVGKLAADYSTVEKNVNRIEIQLERHYQTLLKDIQMFDHLYKQNLQYYQNLTLFILAGEERLHELKSVELPALKVKVSASNDPQMAQQVNDLEQQINWFEKRVHDLKLSRMVSLQLAPQIRMVQNNSVSLMGKLHSSIVNTLPLWRNQMVLLLGIAHTQQAVEAQNAVTDATNKMLQRNSEMLRSTSVKVAKESERSIVDIETIRKVNSELISTIDEVIQIQQDGRQKRMEAEIELRNTENELRQKFAGSKTYIGALNS